MKKIMIFLMIIIFLCGCVAIKLKPYAIGNYNGISNHPYQSVGMYETNDLGYVTRIILNKSRVKRINQNKYYFEIIIRTGE